jgi:putative transcriptional regulator
MKAKQKSKKQVKKTAKFKPKTLMENAHDIASDLHELGVIDLQTMRKFDVMCFPEVKNLSPAQIKNIRLREKVSQPIFAKCLNTSASTVKQWEQGEKYPRGTSLKLLNLVAEQGLGALGCSTDVRDRA